MKGDTLHTCLTCTMVFLCIGVCFGTSCQTLPKAADIHDYQIPLNPDHIAYICKIYPSPYAYCKFELDDPLNDVFVGIGSDATGADFDDNGVMYFCSLGGLYKYDFTTNTTTFIGDTIPFNGLTHDTTTNTWYACTNYGFYMIDISNGETTFIGGTGMGNPAIGLACDNQGNIYTYDVVSGGQSHLYSISKISGAATLIGDMGYGFIYRQDPSYDRDDNILYIAGCDLSTSIGLYTCNVSTGACTNVGYFPGNFQVDGFAIPYNSPSADFSWTPPVPDHGESILFDAGSSSDPNGYITLYEWDWDHDGVYDEAHTTPTATHSFTVPGVYDVTLRVTDNASLMSVKTKSVEVTDQPPSAGHIEGPSQGVVFHECTFSLGPIVDPEDDAIYVKWDWGDGNMTDWLGPYESGQTVTQTHVWTTPGVYAIRNKFKDQFGAETSWTTPFSITIVDNSPPETPTIQGKENGKPGVVYLYTMETTDPENDEVYYLINWGDNTTSGWLGPFRSGALETASHSWDQKGTYNIVIKAKDTFDAESDWGTLQVSMPQPASFKAIFMKFFERLQQSFPLLHYLLETLTKLGDPRILW